MARGKKTGGRSAGIPNKATIERERIAAEIAARTTMDAVATGKKLGKDVLEDFMLLFAGMAAHFQPLPDGAAVPPGRRPDEGKFEKWARLAVLCAEKLAQYQSPTFRAIAVDATLRTSTGQLSDDELTDIIRPQKFH